MTATLTSDARDASFAFFQNETNGTSETGATPSAGDGEALPYSTNETAEGVAEFLAGGAADAIERLLSFTLDVMLSTPYPESEGAGGVPTNEPFATLYADVVAPFVVPAALGVLVAVVLLFVAVLPVAHLVRGGEYRIHKLGVQLVAAVVGTVLWQGIFAVATRAVDAGVTMIAPSPTALTTSVEGIARLSAGTVGDAVITMSLWGVGIVAPIEMSSSWFAAPPRVKQVAFKAAGASRRAGSRARRRVRRRRDDGRE